MYADIYHPCLCASGVSLPQNLATLRFVLDMADRPEWFFTPLNSFNTMVPHSFELMLTYSGIEARVTLFASQREIRLSHAKAYRQLGSDVSLERDRRRRSPGAMVIN